MEISNTLGNSTEEQALLRAVAIWAAKDIDEASKYAARAATLTASVAYAHTDLQTGLQGVRQARHILGPIVYAVFALETANNNDTNVGDDIIRQAVEAAPSEAKQILKHMPPQPKKPGRIEELFLELDSALRG